MGKMSIVDKYDFENIVNALIKNGYIVTVTAGDIDADGEIEEYFIEYNIGE